MKLTLLKQPGDSIEDFIAMATSMQTKLHVYDWFGQRTRLLVESMRHVSFRDISLLPTFESIRLAMIGAMVEQISKAQTLRLDDNEQLHGRRRQEAAVLTNTARRIADLIDNLVSSASPHLVASNLELACSRLNKLWAPSFQDTEAEKKTGDVRNMPGYLSSDEDLIYPMCARVPPRCPAALKIEVEDMLLAFDKNGLAAGRLGERDWENASYSSLKTVYPQCPSFSATLSVFGQKLFVRSTEQRKRIEQAVEDTWEVLGVIRFCHLIILTQLDAPTNWFFDIPVEMNTWPPFEALLAVGGFAGRLAPLSAGVGILAAAAIVSGFGILAINVLTALASRLFADDLQLEYDLKLKLSLDVLPVSEDRRARHGLIQESYFVELEGFDSDADNTETLWKMLASRLKGKHGLGPDTVPGVRNTTSIKPKRWWAKWLQMVADVGRLRTIISDRIHIGIEGLTEAGKSELLTTLADAPPTVFRSGSSLACRTIDIQSYAPDELRTVFLDCPGSDDQDPRIRELSRLFRDLFDVVLFVVPCGEQRSQRTDQYLKEVADFLKERKDPRPVRILLSKIDMFTFHRGRVGEFNSKVAANKKAVVDKIREFGDLGGEFVLRCRKAVRSSQGTGVVIGTETLEDIVQPYSTFAQMSYDVKRALSNCALDGAPDEEPMIQEPAKLRHLCLMTEQGLMWDVESLRQWLRTIDADSVPVSQRRRFS